MATIITVHGTGATGPEEGDRWWQKESPFEKHIRELVESEDGELSYVAFVWDGANSEVSRWRSGSKLLALMKQCEKKREPYAVIGHSHGGSVTADAIVEGSSRTNRLANLKCWMTIGTPFIAY